MLDFTKVKETDELIYNAIMDELDRQQNGLELIASENFVSEAVMSATGSPLTNKYAEGYPGKRYYGGCEFVDVVETVAIERAKELFGAEFANVQPHSGAQANTAVYLAMLEPGDTILGMSLAHGGHLTHGSPVNFSGRYFNIVPYGLNNATETIDYDALRETSRKHKPKLIIAGASSYPRKIDFAKFKAVADEVGAYLMVDMAHIVGLIAAGEHESPVPYADFVTSTTHKTLRGPRAGLILCKEKYGAAINKAVFPGIQGGPLMHIIAAKAVSFKEAMTEEFRAYQQQIVKNAKALAKSLMDEGLRLVSGGTDNHLMLIDLTENGVTGKELEVVLGRAAITVNKNSIPNETRSPHITSGIRIGTPAVTSRGMDEDDMTVIGQLIADVIRNGEDAVDRVRARVLELCKANPLYQ